MLYTTNQWRLVLLRCYCTLEHRRPRKELLWKKMRKAKSEIVTQVPKVPPPPSNQTLWPKHTRYSKQFWIMKHLWRHGDSPHKRSCPQSKFFLRVRPRVLHWDRISTWLVFERPWNERTCHELCDLKSDFSNRNKDDGDFWVIPHLRQI